MAPAFDFLSAVCASDVLGLALELAPRAKAARPQLIACEVMRSLFMRCRGRLKIAVSEPRPMSTSSLSVSRDMLSAFGPANQPVSTGYSAGCCVHQTGTVALENKNDKSLRSRPPQLVHHFVEKRSRILTTLPKPISVLSVTFSRTPR